MKKLFCLLTVLSLGIAPVVGCGGDTKEKKEKTEVKEAAKVKETAEVKKEAAEVTKETAEKK